MVHDRSKSVRDGAFIMTQFSGQEVLVFRGMFVLQGSFGKRGDESFYILQLYYNEVFLVPQYVYF
jgi:hypothetical protein